MAKKFHHPTQIPNQSKKRAEAILWDLHLRGPVVSASGQAVQEFADRLAEVGWTMSRNTVNRIVNGFGSRGGRDGDLYPYQYIARELNGKRTNRIELAVDPDQVAFPDNPFKGWPTFKGTATLAPRKPELPEEGETFARQRQFEGAPPVAEAADEVEPEEEQPAAPPVERPVLLEPEPEPEPEEEPEVVDLLELETEPDPFVGTLEPYRSDAAVRTNGSDHIDDEFDLGDLSEFTDDLLAGLGSTEPRTAMELVSSAISTLSKAMAVSAAETTNLSADVLDRHIDERLGEYRLLMERHQRTEARLRHTLTQYEKAIGIARAQRRQIIGLTKEIARLTGKSKVSA